MTALDDYLAAQQQVPVGGTSGSYAPTVSGGAQTPTPNFGQLITGQDTTHVDPALQATLPDAGDIAAVQAANDEYKRRVAAYHATLDDLASQFTAAFGRGDAATGMRLFAQHNQLLAKGEPAAPDASAIQHQSDRNRLLNTIGGAYQPLIGSLQSAAMGNGPSAALSYYRSAADDAHRRIFGDAASYRGTGGQRSALAQAAMAKAAEMDQVSAGKAAAVGAEEQNQARGSLNAALAGLTNVYGTSNLLGDTQQQQKANQDAQNQAIGLNTSIAESNAKNASDFTKSALSSAASVAKSA